MRVERKIQRDKSREGQRTERKDKETDRKFAAEVRDMLQASWKNTPTLGDASTEAERLTAVLCFLRTELVEFMRTQSHFAGTRGGFVHRDRVAMEAYLMLNDIVRCRRHPIHRFFDGIKEQMGERRPATHDVYLNSALIACVKALQEIDRKVNESEAIRIMLRHPGLGPYTPDLPTMRSRINKSETGSASDEYAELIQHYKNQMLNDLPASREKILSCAFNIASLIGHPLSMEAATTILDYSLVVRDENGTKLIRPPERAPLLVTAETEEGSGNDPSTA